MILAPPNIAAPQMLLSHLTRSHSAGPTHAGVFLATADLFCGAGGLSEGERRAAKRLGVEVKTVAVNHSAVAIRTHSVNHPDVLHFCDEMENADPRKLVPSGHLVLLKGAPECIFFSNARGAKPMNDQSRASVRYLLRWVRELTVENILVENVREFAKWGPLHPCTCGLGDDPKADHRANGCLYGRPVKEREGEYFDAFLAELRGLGYRAEWRILTAADYGDATTRERFFLQAKLGPDNPITWPLPTHAPRAVAPASGRRAWRCAREIIDWSVPGVSIYGRKSGDRHPPLKPNTHRRIESGLFKFCGLDLLSGADASFLIGQQSGAAPRSLDEPVPTIATAGRIALLQPYLVVLRNNQDSRPLGEPVPAITAGGTHMGFAEPRLRLENPFLIPVTHSRGPSRSHSIDAPVPTITGATRGEFAVCRPELRPFLMKYHGSHAGKSDGDGRSYSVEDPIATLDTSNRFAVAQPFVMVNRTHGTPLSLDDPLRTLTTGGNFGLVQPRLRVDEPFLVSYYGQGGPLSLSDPLDTITTKDRFALVSPEFVAQGLIDGGDVVGWLDVLFRMLLPRELAGAHSFPATYFFFGTQQQQVKQVGNSVPTCMAEALCLEILRPYAPVVPSQGSQTHGLKEAV